MTSPKPIEVSVTDVAALLEGGSVALIDCREPDEWETARVEGATLIPMNSTPDRLAEFPNDRPIVVHCHHGMRSLRVAEYLRANGYPDAQSMAGGIDAWSQHVDPGVPRY